MMNNNKLLEVFILANFLLGMLISQGWVEENQISASTKGDFDNFGWSAAINEKHFLVGAPQCCLSCTCYKYGIAYIFSRNAAGWTEQAILTASQRNFRDFFGHAVGLAQEHALVGAIFADPGSIVDAGAAYIFTLSSGSWKEHMMLTANDKQAHDFFSTAAWMTENYILIGADLSDPGSITDSGAGYIFYRNGQIWTQQAKLTASNKQYNARLGLGVSLTDNYAILGARNSSPGSVHQAGMVYVFVRTGSVWREQAILTASNKQTNDRFGYSVSINGDFSFVGLESLATRTYIFSRTGESWRESQVLNLATLGDRCIQSTAEYLIVRNYLFSRSGDMWIEYQTLGRNLGHRGAVALTEKIAIVGNYEADSGGIRQAGVAYTFINKDLLSASRSLSPTQSQTWISKLPVYHSTITLAGFTGNGFGNSIAFFKNYSIISNHDCTFDLSSLHCGRVFILAMNKRAWDLVSVIRHPGNVTGVSFGRVFSVAKGWLFIPAERLIHKVDRKWRKSFVYTFLMKENGSMERRGRLHAPKPFSYSYGRSIATNGLFVAVGAPLSFDKRENQEVGAVLFYHINESRKWERKAYTIQPGALRSYERFGSSVAMNHENQLAIGTQCDCLIQVVYVYQLHGRNIMTYQTIQMENRRGFGMGLYFSDEYLFISAPFDSHSKNQTGSVHLYKMSMLRRFEYQTEISITQEEGSQAGSTICVSREYLMVAKFVCKGESKCSKGGSISIFRNISGDYVFIGSLSGTSENGSDGFGSSVSCNDDIIMIGAPYSDVAILKGGTVYVYEW